MQWHPGPLLLCEGMGWGEQHLIFPLLETEPRLLQVKEETWVSGVYGTGEDVGSDPKAT